VLEAGGFRKILYLTVKIATQSINVEDEYIVLKIGERYQLNPSISPNDADPRVSYKSNAPTVATVNDGGLIYASKSGAASITISTWDSSKIISVIVNTGGGTTHTDNDTLQDVVTSTDDLSELAKSLRSLAEGGVITVNGSELKVVTFEIMNELYGTDKKLVIRNSGYTILIVGKDLKNINNELKTLIFLRPVNNGLEVLVNDGANLPGKINIELLDGESYNHLYLYNGSKHDYQEINTIADSNKFEIDLSGKYLLTHDKLKGVNVNWLLVFIATFVILCGVGIAYVATKKQYWFW
jgi:hypothetical protein